MDPLMTAGPLLRMPQTQQAAPGQIENRAGGWVFPISWEEALDRFLILGAVDTYYASNREIAADAAAMLRGALDAHGVKVVDRIVAVSVDGRNFKQNPVLWALAVASAHPDAKVRRAALTHLPDVCRTGSMLFTFLKYARQFRGFGRGMRKALAEWYDRDDLAYQLVKYRQRDGWTHRDVLRVAHPILPARNAQLAWATGKPYEDAGSQIGAFELLQSADPTSAAWLIRSQRLPWEAVPDALLNEPIVLEALFESMPAVAAVRQLPRYTRAGLTGSAWFRDQLPRKLQHSRDLHPLRTLNALITYSRGRGERSEWTPDPWVIDQLDIATEQAFTAAEPTKARYLVAIDTSGSMHHGDTGTPLMPYQAAGVLAVGFAKIEPNVVFVGFDTALQVLGISSRQRYDDVARFLAGIGGGGTDCAIPILTVLKARDPFDAIVIISDNETWRGRVHPFQAMRDYRATVNPHAKLVAIATVANPGSISQPSSPLDLNCVGWDPTIYDVATRFTAGNL